MSKDKSNHILYETMGVITYACANRNQTMLANGA